MVGGTWQGSIPPVECQDAGSSLLGMLGKGWKGVGCWAVKVGAIGCGILLDRCYGAVPPVLGYVGDRMARDGRPPPSGNPQTQRDGRADKLPVCCCPVQGGELKPSAATKEEYLFTLWGAPPPWGCVGSKHW
jgi:hypothetical protein